jgi:hypothetical protein
MELCCASVKDNPFPPPLTTMEVFAVTVFVSLMFAVLFAVLFFAERSQRQSRSLEQDALLPLDREPCPQPVRSTIVKP